MLHGVDGQAVFVLAWLSHAFEPVRVWYASHLALVQPYADWMVESHMALRISGVACALYCWSIWHLGVEYHDARRAGRSVKHFPRAFLVTIVVQIPPLLILGCLLGDVFIITTRAMMLATVIVVYGLTLTDADGRLNTRKFHLWITSWLLLCILVPMSWVHDGAVRKFVEHNEKLISWTIVMTMLVFMIGGQLTLAKDLFWHFFTGESSTKRFRSQLPRFLMLATQMFHYWFAASGAVLVLGLDPVFLQSGFGAIGSLVAIVAALVGMIVSCIAAMLGIKMHRRTVDD